MSMRQRPLRFPVPVLAVLAAACVSPTEDAPPVPSQVRAGTTATGDVVVDRVDPASTLQDTTLDVRVLGGGFDKGSTVEFAIDEVVTQKVRVNRVRFKNSSELVANITVVVDAPAEKYDVLVTTSKGKKGIGIEKFEVSVRIHPNSILVFSSLPAAPGAGDGLYSDSRGHYPGSTTEPDYKMRVDAQCPDGRSFLLDLPDAWKPSILSGAESHCSGGSGDGPWSVLHGIVLGSCPDGLTCPTGTTGHDPSTSSFAPDLRYFWRVDPARKGKSQWYGYNVVWVDAQVRVTAWAGGAANGTPCQWRLTATQAELWQGNPTLQRLDSGILPMALDLTVSRGDDVCQ